MQEDVQVAAIIAQNNINFEAMSPEQKRVQIAKDVLEQLDKKHLVADYGNWAISDDESLLYKKSIYSDQNISIKKLLNETKKCRVCALGSLFVCAVDRSNNLIVDDLHGIYSPDQKDVFNYLSNFFLLSQIKLIEFVYEQGQGWNRSCYPYDTEAALNFFSPEEKKIPELRMKKIMLNIIANNGEFVL